MRVQCYNESNYPANTVQLHDPVDTLDVSGVGLSLPSGVLKLNSTKTYSHLSFAAFGETWIVRVTGIDNLGDTLSNVRYEVDYLKDYFAKYGERNGSYKVLRTSNSALWNEREFDSQYKTTGVFNTSTLNNLLGVEWYSSSLPGVSRYGLVACTMTTMVGTVATYLFKSTGWYEFVKTVLDTADAHTSIQGAVLFPYSFESSLETTAASEIALAGGVTVTVTDCSLVTAANPKEVTLVSYQPQINDFRDLYLKTYHLYIPLIGVTQVPINHLNGTPLKIKYTFSLVDGSVAVQFGDDVATRITGGRFPEVPLISSAEPTRIVNALTSGAGGLIASGVAAIANPVAGLVSAGTTIANTAIGIATAGIGALSVSRVSGYYAVTNNRFILSVVSTGYLNTIAEYAHTTGLLSGEVLSQLQQLPIGRHLINSDFNVIGAPWYMDGVKRAYSDWVYVG